MDYCAVSKRQLWRRLVPKVCPTPTYEYANSFTGFSYSVGFRICISDYCNSYRGMHDTEVSVYKLHQQNNTPSSTIG